MSCWLSRDVTKGSVPCVNDQQQQQLSRERDSQPAEEKTNNTGAQNCRKLLQVH